MARQYVKHKFNLFELKASCGRSVTAYDVEFYQGAVNGVFEEYKHLGLGGTIVMHLVEHMPENQNVKIYFDNIFTSILLLLKLKAIGML